MPSIAARLDRLHARVRAHPLLYRFTLATRLLLAMGFIPTGMVKLLGMRFTHIGTDSPVGMLFEVLYDGGGMYWRFLGAVQVAAGVLILVPATATLGAMIFFPLILNIFVITVSYGFRGTPFVTGPMVMASLYLLCWDYDRLRGTVLSGRYGEGQALDPPVRSLGARWEGIAYAAGGLAVMGVLMAMRIQAPVRAAFVMSCLAIGAAAAVAALAGAWSAWKRRDPVLAGPR
ncbi:hypothetical protein [Longimicrobium sp.]|jgi:hypothetical protein|uniref:hypothetical protein n=1 Tax=Longimicrobium sp. TaxID=2029185 RepID=UPI002F93A920